MPRRGNARLLALLTSRPIRLALIAPIAGLALLASTGALRPSGVAANYSGCVSTPFGPAVLYNPPFTVSGIVDATGCYNGIVYDGGHSGTIKHATISGVEDNPNGVGPGDGDGVRMAGSGTVTITSSTLDDNEGVGVEATNGSNLVMQSDDVEYNHSNGIAIDTGSTATINLTEVAFTSHVDNSERPGDGILLGSSSGGSGLVTVTRSNIFNNYNNGVEDLYDSQLVMGFDNVSFNAGNGVNIQDGSTATINSSFINNTVMANPGGNGDGDGVLAEGSDGVTIAGSQVNGNADDGIDYESARKGSSSIRGQTPALYSLVMRADVVKGNLYNGLYLEDAPASVRTSVFVLNDSILDSGAGVYLSYESNATLTDVVVQQNVLDGIFVEGGSDAHATLTMTHTFVQINGDVGLDNLGTTTSTVSDLCKNHNGDLDNEGTFNNHGTIICNTLPEP
jgi:hypothetical protein